MCGCKSSHLVSKGAGAVVGAHHITDTGPIVLTRPSQAGGTLGHQVNIYWTCRGGGEREGGGGRGGGGGGGGELRGGGRWRGKEHC